MARPHELIEALDAAEGIVAVVGAGGKKTTMYTLAALHPGRVALAATSHMYPFDRNRVDSIVTVSPDSPPAVGAGRVVAFAGVTDTPKRVGGLSGEQIAALHDDQRFALTVVKADGARARLVKAPADHEPVIPACARLVIAIVSASAIGQPLDERIAHRPERIAAVTGAEPGEPLLPVHVGRLLASAAGALKDVGTRPVIALINAVDDDADGVAATAAAETALALTDRLERVVLAAMKVPRLYRVIDRAG